MFGFGSISNMSKDNLMEMHNVICKDPECPVRKGGFDGAASFSEETIPLTINVDKNTSEAIVEFLSQFSPNKTIDNFYNDAAKLFLAKLTKDVIKELLFQSNKPSNKDVNQDLKDVFLSLLNEIQKNA